MFNGITTSEKLWALKIALKNTNDWKFYVPNWICPWPVALDKKSAEHNRKQVRSYLRACKIVGFKLKIVELE